MKADKDMVEKFINLGYSIKGEYLYVPLVDFLLYYPEERKNWPPNIEYNTYVMLPINCLENPKTLAKRNNK